MCTMPTVSPSTEKVRSCSKSARVSQPPKWGYYQSARDALESSANLDSVSERSKMETIIYQASAAPGLGDLEVFVTSLKKGVLMARELGSQLRYRDAFEIYHSAPEKWQNERKVKDLAVNVFKQTDSSVEGR